VQRDTKLFQIVAAVRRRKFDEWSRTQIETMGVANSETGGGCRLGGRPCLLAQVFPGAGSRAPDRGGELVAEVMGTGTLEARVKSTVSPKIAGRIEQLVADQGDLVQAGQLLFTLDDAELKQQVEIARANIASAEAALERLQADRAQMAAILEQAQNNHERVQKLVLRGRRHGRGSGQGDRGAERGSGRGGSGRGRAAGGPQAVDRAERNLDFRLAVLADTQVRLPSTA
jgi:HlyD family secretion protein